MFDELIEDQGECMFVFEYDHLLDSVEILSYATHPMPLDRTSISSLYLFTCTIPEWDTSNLGYYMITFFMEALKALNMQIRTGKARKKGAVVRKKKYKLVAQKVKPVVTELPLTY